MDHGSTIKQLLCKIKRKLESRGNKVTRSYAEIDNNSVSLIVTYLDTKGKSQEYISIRRIRDSLTCTLKSILDSI